MLSCLVITAKCTKPCSPSGERAGVIYGPFALLIAAAPPPTNCSMPADGHGVPSGQWGQLVMKTIGIAGIAAGLAVMLAGCQTTGGGTAATAASYMGAANAASSAYMGGGGSPAGSTMAATQVDDGKKSCEQLRAEIEETQKIKESAASDASSAGMTSTVSNVATSFVGYFGGVGAMQATNAAGQLTAQQKAQAEQQARDADVRLQVLGGIYQGKNC